MNATDLVKSLIQLGVTVKDVVSKSHPGGPIDWTKAAKDVLGDADVSKELKAVVAALGNDTGKAIAEIQAKQKTLLAGRAISALPHDELLQYSDLSDARLVLSTQQLTGAMSGGVLEWLVNEALPKLIDIAPVIIPLLL